MINGLNWNMNLCWFACSKRFLAWFHIFNAITLLVFLVSTRQFFLDFTFHFIDSLVFSYGYNGNERNCTSNGANWLFQFERCFNIYKLTFVHLSSFAVMISCPLLNYKETDAINNQRMLFDPLNKRGKKIYILFMRTF